ncbi:MAG: hypothetical protein JWO92_318, partial [Chitinophagaceae bacterium]|nr:hypothetical protein [Chitinophagaceae bacterium]
HKCLEKVEMGKPEKDSNKTLNESKDGVNIISRVDACRTL